VRRDWCHTPGRAPLGLGARMCRPAAEEPMIDPARIACFELFIDFSEASLAAFAAATEARQLAAGEAAFRLGDGGGDLFLIERGEVEIVLESLEERHGIARMGAGMFFGETSMLSPGLRTATVVAMRDTAVLVVSVAAFNAMIDASDVDALRLARRLGVAMAARARSNARFMQQVLASQEEDYKRPMSGAMLPVDNEEVTGPLQVRHAYSLEYDDLLDLFEGRILAIRIPTWYPRWLCEKIARRLLRHPGFARYLMAQDVGVQRIGMTLFEAESDARGLDAYYASAQDTMWSIRRHCFPFLTPIERLRLELDELWPSGAMIESLHGRKMLCGVARMFEDSHSLPPHQDVLARDVPDSRRAAAMKSQLAINCYIRAPREGGDLELWDIDPNTEEYERLRDGRYDFLDRAKLPPSAGKIRPDSGELLLMRSDRVHAVHPSVGGPRMAMSCFIGFYGRDRALSLWS
jgi:CRP-like cAMP-binding protein